MSTQPAQQKTRTRKCFVNIFDGVDCEHQCLAGSRFCEKHSKYGKGTFDAKKAQLIRFHEQNKLNEKDARIYEKMLVFENLYAPEKLVCELCGVNSAHEGFKYCTACSNESKPTAVKTAAVVERSETHDEQSESGEAVPASEASGESQYPELAFPYHALPDGRLKELTDKACEGGLSAGLVVPALLALVSSIPLQDRVEGAQINLYMTLLAMVGCGKDTAIDRAGSVLGLHTADAGWVGGNSTVYTPSGERSVAMLIGSKPGTKENPEQTPGPRTHCIISYELEDTLNKNRGETSSLFPMMQHMYDHKQKEFNDTKWRHKQVVDCRLSWITGLPVGNDEIDEDIYRKAFGDSSSNGFVSRMLFGFAEQRVDRRTSRNWHVDASEYTTVTEKKIDLGDGPVATVEIRTTLEQKIRDHKCKGFAQGVGALYEKWNPAKDWTGRDVSLHVLKVAAVTAIANGNEYIEKADWLFAVAFMEWQGKIREIFQSGTAKRTTQAEFNEIVVKAVDKYLGRAPSGDETAWTSKQRKVYKVIGGKTFVNWRQVSGDSKWWRHGADIPKTVKGLVAGGAFVPMVEDGEVNEGWVRPAGNPRSVRTKTP